LGQDLPTNRPHRSRKHSALMIASSQS
jgi:hypothetical protein